MYQVEDEPMETIHLYVVREGEQCPSLIPVIISVIALSILIAIGILIPYKQPEQRVSIRVPAVLSFAKSYSASINILQTGVKHYAATVGSGTLTVYSGSSFIQIIPAGAQFIGKDGVTVATDSEVTVPTASPPNFGSTRVQAHALISGRQGNIRSYDIDSVEGSSIYVRNLTAFHGGADAYSVKFTTPQDRQIALNHARQIVRQASAGLHYPCQETVSNILTWHCQFVTYSIPLYMHVTSMRLHGKEVLIHAWFVTRPRPIWFK